MDTPAARLIIGNFCYLVAWPVTQSSLELMGKKLQLGLVIDSLPRTCSARYCCALLLTVPGVFDCKGGGGGQL